MNILVPFMRQHAETVDRLADAERVSFEQLVDATEGYDVLVGLDRTIGAQLTGWQPFGSFLLDAYLPVIENERWRAQVASAALPDPEGTVRREWVTFAPGRHSLRGLALPDDAMADFRVSLFTSAPESLDRVSVEYAAGRLPTGVSFSLAYGCSLPAWGECRGEECRGDCRLTRVHDDNDGLVCRCPHLDEWVGAMSW